MFGHDDYNPPAEPFLDILYEDPAIMVLNKPSGILTVPGKEEHLHDCILTRVQKKYPLAAAAHRLDMSTSGLLVVPKTRIAAGVLGRQFQDRTVEKRYFAWVAGVVTRDEGEIDLPIALDDDNKPLQKIDFVRGRRAVTQFRCLWRGSDRSFMRLHPVTGRSHQLRLHMKELGHPILGDKWYATPEIRDMADHLNLHAGELSFNDPTTGKRVCFRVDPPFDLPPGVTIYQD